MTNARHSRTPLTSNRDDNVIFRDESGNPIAPQLLAFEDV
jgi:hypothetical protein